MMDGKEQVLSGKWRHRKTGTIYNRVTHLNGIYTVTNEAGSQYFVSKDKLEPIPNRTEETVSTPLDHSTRPTVEELVESAVFKSHLMSTHKQQTEVLETELVKIVQAQERKAKIEVLSYVHRADNEHDYDNETDEFIDEVLESLNLTTEEEK